MATSPAFALVLLAAGGLAQLEYLNRLEDRTLDRPAGASALWAGSLAGLGGGVLAVGDFHTNKVSLYTPDEDGLLANPPNRSLQLNTAQLASLAGRRGLLVAGDVGRKEVAVYRAGDDGLIPDAPSAVIPAPSGAQQFGASVAVLDDPTQELVAVGDWGANQVTIWKWTGDEGGFTQLQALMAPDEKTSFGCTLAALPAEGGLLVGDCGLGRVTMYAKEAGSLDGWALTEAPVTSFKAEGHAEQFGKSLAAVADIVVVGDANRAGGALSLSVFTKEAVELSEEDAPPQPAQELDLAGRQFELRGKDIYVAPVAPHAMAMVGSALAVGDIDTQKVSFWSYTDPDQDRESDRLDRQQAFAVADLSEA